MQKPYNNSIPKIRNPFLRGIFFILLLPISAIIIILFGLLTLIPLLIKAILKIISYSLLKITANKYKPYRFMFFDGGLIIDLLSEINKCTELSKIDQILRERQEEINDQLAISICDLPSQILVGRSPKMQRKIAYDIIRVGDIFQSLLFGDSNLNIIIAIAAYQVSLNVFSDQNSVEWARIQNSIGVAFQKYSYSEARRLIIKSLASEGDVLSYLLPIKTSTFDFGNNKFTLGETLAR